VLARQRGGVSTTGLWVRGAPGGQVELAAAYCAGGQPSLTDDVLMGRAGDRGRLGWTRRDRETGWRVGVDEGGVAPRWRSPSYAEAAGPTVPRRRDAVMRLRLCGDAGVGCGARWCSAPAGRRVAMCSGCEVSKVRGWCEPESVDSLPVVGDLGARTHWVRGRSCQGAAARVRTPWRRLWEAGR